MLNKKQMGKYFKNKSVDIFSNSYSYRKVKSDLVIDNHSQLGYSR